MPAETWDDYLHLVVDSAAVRVDPGPSGLPSVAYRIDVAYATGRITRQQHAELLADLGVLR